MAEPRETQQRYNHHEEIGEEVYGDLKSTRIHDRDLRTDAKMRAPCGDAIEPPRSFHLFLQGRHSMLPSIISSHHLAGDHRKRILGPREEEWMVGL